MSDKIIITKEEFEQGYASRSGMTVEELRDMGGYAQFCNCEYDKCEGWQMMFKVSISAERIRDGELPYLMDFGTKHE
jgi:hypothetical protein